MPDLIPPHGGLAEPIDRHLPADRAANALREAERLPRVPVSKADLATLYRIGDGGLSPLTGPMTKAEWDRYFQVLQAADPYGRLTSIHHSRVMYDHGRSWLTHASASM